MDTFPLGSQQVTQNRKGILLHQFHSDNAMPHQKGSSSCKALGYFHFPPLGKAELVIHKSSAETFIINELL